MKYIKGLLVPEVGDKVLVRSDLQGKTYENYNTAADFATPQMVKFAGKRVTITAIGLNGKFYVKEAGGWFWTTEMFDLSEYNILSPDLAIDICDLFNFLGV